LADVALSMVDMVTEEDRTTLVPGQCQRVVSVLQLETSNVFDYGHIAAAY
jgi:hypothetical protein